MTLEEFENTAEQFYIETGLLAPGKDVPALRAGDLRYDHDMRRKRWDEWLRRRIETERK